MEFEESRRCDFCDLGLEEDEQFTEVRLGPLPQPQRIRVDEVGATYRNETGRAAQGRVLMEALSGHPSFEVDGSNMVEEVRSVGGDVHWTSAAEQGTMPEISRFESELRDDKVGVRLVVYPEPEEQEPAAKLCPRCVKMFD